MISVNTLWDTNRSTRSCLHRTRQPQLTIKCRFPPLIPHTDSKSAAHLLTLCWCVHLHRKWMKLVCFEPHILPSQKVSLGSRRG